MGREVHWRYSAHKRGLCHGNLFCACVVFRSTCRHCTGGVRLADFKTQKLKGEIDMKVYCVKPPRLIRAILKMFLRDQ